MTPNRAFLEGLKTSRQIAMEYLRDLSDADLMLRPVAGMNHIAWQLGHLISAEHSIASAIGAKLPPLPSGFAEAYDKETSKVDDASKFHAKSLYIELMTSVREGVEATLEKASAADFDQPSPESMRNYAPTVGAAYALLAAHELMHAGQWVAVRRSLGKPALF